MPRPPAESVPPLLMPPLKVPIVTEAPDGAAFDAWPPTKMPLLAAVMVPLLTMAPRKAETATVVEERAVPPTMMPLAPLDTIVPELLMLPTKVEIVTEERETLWPPPTPPLPPAGMVLDVVAPAVEVPM